VAAKAGRIAGTGVSKRFAPAGCRWWTL